MHNTMHEVKQKVEVEKPEKTTVTLRTELSRSTYKLARRAHANNPRTFTWADSVDEMLRAGALAKLNEK